jgi:hypothetical protein
MISDGKVSSERVLKEEYKRKIEAGESLLDEMKDTGGEHETSADMSHEEFSILDKAGRVRLSAEMREAAGIDTNRVKVDIVDGKIVISNEK